MYRRSFTISPSSWTPETLVVVQLLALWHLLLASKPLGAALYPLRTWLLAQQFAKASTIELMMHAASQLRQLSASSRWQHSLSVNPSMTIGASPTDCENRSSSRRCSLKLGICDMLWTCGHRKTTKLNTDKDEQNKSRLTSAC